MLTDKCKIEFEKWLEYRFEDIRISHSHQFIFSPYHHFHLLPFPMQYGVYVYFFKEKGICIYHSPGYMLKTDYHWFRYQDKMDMTKTSKHHETIHECIQKANEIFNNLNN